MIKRRELTNFFGIYALLTFSCLLYAVAFCWFYDPNGISVGGFTGVSQIANHIFDFIPIGISTIVLNIPLFITAVKLQGAKLFIRSLYCMTVCSVFVDIVPLVFDFKPMDDVLLACIFGGVIVGVASGIQIKVNATNGGSELAARLLKYKFHHISVGKLCMIIDVAVIICYAVVFGQLTSALYGIVSMYVLSIVVDFVVYGGNHAKMAYIISNESEKIREKLTSMNLGVTTVDSHGGWSQDEKQMILCAFRPRQIGTIKEAVTAIDKRAFVIVCDAHEVLGEGFQTYTPDSL